MLRFFIFKSDLNTTQRSMFSNKNQGLQKKRLMEKIAYFCGVRKDYSITYDLHGVHA